MTTTEHLAPPPPPPAPQQHVLRRSRTDRVGAGVAGGLGRYFGVDPVLFRVLFATAAFFGGAGVLAYLLAWAAIPEEGTVRAPIDRFVSELRRRRVPLWIVAIIGALIVWGVAFSWWMPGHAFPVIVLVIVLVALLTRRGRRNAAPPESTTAPELTQPLTATEPAAAATETGPPAWVDEGKKWISEAKAARRERRYRAAPVRIATVVALITTLGILGAVDASTGIPIPVYFWVIGGIAGLGLLTGVVLRRTPWSVAPLLIPAIVGLVAFGGTRASMHDGTGKREWVPTSAAELKDNYRIAFGQGVLDLRHMGTLTAPRTVDIRLAAGQIKVIAPTSTNVIVNAYMHAGNIAVDGEDRDDNGGWNVSRTILPATSAHGALLTIVVHVADGNITVDHV